MILKQHLIKFFTKKSIRIFFIILILIFSYLYLGEAIRQYHYKKILTKNLWYTSSITKLDNSSLEKPNFLESWIYKFDDSNKYIIYELHIPSISLRNQVYYGNETYTLSTDSLILDDYMRAKIYKISEDSIVLTARMNFNYLDSNYRAKGVFTMLKYTLKPIYVEKLGPDTLKREQRSSTYVIID